MEREELSRIARSIRQNREVLGHLKELAHQMDEATKRTEAQLRNAKKKRNGQ